MWNLSIWVLAAAVIGLGGSQSGAAEPVTLVVCAPGYPGSTAEAQPTMDFFAEVAVRTASWPDGELTVEYHESEDGGLERLAKPDAALVLASLPFFVKHQENLGLEPLAQVVPDSGIASEQWSLVAAAGAVTGPQDLAGWEVVSLAAFAPGFMRGPALGGWGELPADLEWRQSAAVLSALRKAARGDQVAVLLDRSQSESLASLPFADRLEVVYHSPSWPVGVLCVVKQRLADEPAAQLQAALLRLHQTEEGAEALAAMRLERFVEVDSTAVAAALQAAEKGQ